MNNNQLKLIQFFISIFLLIYLFSNLDISAIIYNIKSINYYFFLIGLFLFLPGIIISNFKWNIILKYYQINIKNTLSIYWIGIFFNNFLPSSFGGDGYRFYRINKNFKEKKKENFSSILFERVTGILCIAFINLIGFLFFYNDLFKNDIIKTITIGVFLLSILIILISIYGHFIYKIMPLKKLRDRLKSVYIIIKTIPRKLLFYNLILSFIFYILIFIAYLAYFKAVGINISNINLYLLFYIISIINLFGLFPISLNGIGISESLQVLLFSNIFGISPELILLSALLGRLGGISMSSIGGIIYLGKNNNN